MNLRKLNNKNNYIITLKSTIIDIINKKLHINLVSPKGLTLDMVNLNNINPTSNNTECIIYFDLTDLNYKYSNITDESCDDLNCSNCIFDHTNVKELLKLQKYKQQLINK